MKSFLLFFEVILSLSVNCPIGTKTEIDKYGFPDATNTNICFPKLEVAKTIHCNDPIRYDIV